MSIKKEKTETYQLEPPEGGWGYVIAAALTIACNATLIPMTCFGIIYGPFLASIGDETAGTTLSNGMFNTAFNITGLIASYLLKKYTLRCVGLIGASIFCLGSFSTILANSLPFMIISFGVVQGVGMGLLFPALFTALNSYFDRKLTLMNNIAQAFMVLACMLYPMMGNYLVTTFGFRGTVAILAGLSLNAVLAAITLQPVEWHLKRVEIKEIEMQEEPNLKPLLEVKAEEGTFGSRVLVPPKPRNSIISIGDRAVSVGTMNKVGLDEEEHNEGFWQSFDVSLFKDASYLNLVTGLSLGFNADVCFISLLPLILFNFGYGSSDIALFMTVHFASDFAGRIILSVVSALLKVNNWAVFLITSLFIVILRSAFILGEGYTFRLVSIGILGFLRCFIQSPLPCVISDRYSDNFSTAFSLYMVVCGLISLALGPLMAFVKSYTGTDVAVVHLLSLCYSICVVSWCVEIGYKKLTRRK